MACEKVFWPALITFLVSATYSFASPNCETLQYEAAGKLCVASLNCQATYIQNTFVPSPAAALSKRNACQTAALNRFKKAYTAAQNHKTTSSSCLMGVAETVGNDLSLSVGNLQSQLMDEWHGGFDHNKLYSAFLQLGGRFCQQVLKLEGQLQRNHDAVKTAKGLFTAEDALKKSAQTALNAASKYNVVSPYSSEELLWAVQANSTQQG